MNFLQNQNDPELPELKERLRNQFQFFGDDMMMTGAIGEWAAPLGERRRVARGAAAGRAGRLAQREQRGESGGADADRRGVRGGEQGVRHHRPALGGPHRSRGDRRSAHAASRARLAACRWAAFRWVTSTDPKVVVGPPFRTIVDHGIQTGIMGDGVHIAPLNPWQHIYFATTGVNSFGARVNGDQQLTREEALRLFTRGNSWFLRMEEKIGTIEAGQARGSGRPGPRLFRGARRRDQADPIGADGRRRQDRPRLAT